MIFDYHDERVIREHLKENDWHGRWEGVRAACPIAIWIEGETGSLTVRFSARRGLRVYSGEDKLLRNTLDRLDTICRDDLKAIPERFEEIPEEVKPHRAPRKTAAGTRRQTGGSRPKLAGFSLCDLLHWMGANQFSTFDATNAFHHLGLTCSKNTITRAMAKGKSPERDGITLPELPDDVVATLMQFHDLARKTG